MVVRGERINLNDGKSVSFGVMGEDGAIRLVGTLRRIDGENTSYAGVNYYVPKKGDKPADKLVGTLNPDGQVVLLASNEMLEFVRGPVDGNPSTQGVWLITYNKGEIVAESFLGVVVS